jgi:FtsH-binding integral membrane protein
MEFDKQGILNREKAAQQTAAVMDEGLRAYMLKVYNYMATGVLLTGIIALLSFKMSVVTDANGSIVSLTQFGSAIYMSGLKWIVMLAPLAIVFYMSFGINKMSASKAQTTFWVFAALMGLSSVINFISLYRFKCNKSFLYLFCNFWCNEYLWLHN